MLAESFTSPVAIVPPVDGTGRVLAIDRKWNNI